MAFSCLHHSWTVPALAVLRPLPPSLGVCASAPASELRSTLPPAPHGFTVTLFALFSGRASTLARFKLLFSRALDSTRGFAFCFFQINLVKSLGVPNWILSDLESDNLHFCIFTKPSICVKRNKATLIEFLLYSSGGFLSAPMWSVSIPVYLNITLQF